MKGTYLFNTDLNKNRSDIGAFPCFSFVFRCLLGTSRKLSSRWASRMANDGLWKEGTEDKWRNEGEGEKGENQNIKADKRMRLDDTPACLFSYMLCDLADDVCHRGHFIVWVSSWGISL